MGNKFGAFLIGGLAGAVLGLLYAPRSGQETRAIVTDKVNAAWGEAQEFGTQAAGGAQQVYQDVAARGQEVAHNVASKGQELYGQAQAKVQEAAGNVKPAFSDKDDELRVKIEAARQRIAAQVAKNAEAAHETVSDKIPVAADAAQDAADAAKKAVDEATGTTPDAPTDEPGGDAKQN